MRLMSKSFFSTRIRRATSGSHFAGKLSEKLFLFAYSNFDYSNRNFIPKPRFDSKASYDPSWRTDVCITENLMENITRCICPISGTFVVLLVKKSFNVSCFLCLRDPMMPHDVRVGDDASEPVVSRLKH